VRLSRRGKEVSSRNIGEHSTYSTTPCTHRHSFRRMLPPQIAACSKKDKEEKSSTSLQVCLSAQATPVSHWVQLSATTPMPQPRLPAIKAFLTATLKLGAHFLRLAQP